MKKWLMNLLFGQCIIIKKVGADLIVDATAGNFTSKEIQKAATLFFNEAYHLRT